METQEVQQTLSPRAQNMVTLLGRLGYDDPRLPLIAGIMDQQTSVETDNHNIEESPPERTEHATEIERIIEENEYLKEENELMAERIDVLTSALGICPECLGEDNTCEVCHGEGAPGNHLPEKEMFTRFVLPVTARLRRRSHRERHVQSNAVGEDETGTSNQEQSKSLSIGEV